MKICFLALFAFLLLSCCNQTKGYREKCSEKINQLERSDLDLFRGVFIEARVERNDTFIVYSFVKELNGQEFYLPNFSRYDSMMISNSKNFDVLKYGQYFGYSAPQAAWQYSKEYADSIISTFEKMRVSSVLGRNEGMLVFYFDDKTYLAYVPDKTKIINEFWKEKMQTLDSVKPGWYFGEDK
ncbi:hypothetical protein SAMN05660909_01186 [Chitinophaga terrae (ex Kim and Jung 2007)]|uniref:Lipoprotein n=1 Tax=Chitinophaga terrae (ex Kim and Jung 2007) TaxID=408074 RepID=A0A1H3ZEJ6_9BACT|nr:hypothetical protein [Chitinophaga terrae (ex Kim and Jung 2007)]GEP88715.1 hypothetical protein CTE07_03600 [Chitinophaga terrae (ex Kim and Jung 2007)]SEA22189.1 hypothetical protein SAMN05660909_01186 [Chitinophaga terrae (ex Kim and Jung 2007)]